MRLAGFPTPLFRLARQARLARLSVAALGIAATGSWAAPAAADVQHVVAKGHTLDAIANRYHVTAKAIVEKNHIANADKLKPGDVLVIPTTETGGSKGKNGDGKKVETVAKAGKTPTGRETTTYAMKPKTPGVIHVKRLATTEEFDVRVDQRGKVPATTLKTFEKMMRSPNGMAHPIEPRLITLLGIVSNHFGSRKIEIVSGFRPFTPSQYNPHSNHMHGKAVDFRVVGVPNETLRDFCRTLKNVGCGYYPNSVFVHMDVREQSAFWIDYSKPGEAPRYNAPNLDADEGASDVHDENHPATGSAPDDPLSSGATSTESLPATSPSPSSPSSDE